MKRSLRLLASLSFPFLFGLTAHAGSAPTCFEPGDYLWSTSRLQLADTILAGPLASGSNLVLIVGRSLVLVDATDPLAPHVVSSLDISDNWSPGTQLAAVDGYAFVKGAAPEIRIYDIRDPGFPVLASTIAPAGGIRAFCVQGDFVYFIDTGIGIVDWSDPLAPFIVSQVGTPGDPNAIAVWGDRGFVLSTLGSDDLEVPDASLFTEIDLSPPTSPSVVATYQAEILSVEDGGPNYYSGVSTSGGLLWIAKAAYPTSLHDAVNRRFLGEVEIPVHQVEGTLGFTFGQGFSVSDIADPIRPRFINNFWVDTPAIHSSDGAVLGDFAFMASKSVLWGVDHTRMSSPPALNNVPTGTRVRSMDMSGDTMIVAQWQSGLVLLDVAQPELPVVRATRNTPGDSNDVEIFGSFAAVADGAYGLQIVEIGAETLDLVGSLGGLGSLNSVAARGDRVYAGDRYPNFYVVDVHDPRSPQLLGSADVGTAVRNIAIDGDLAFAVSGIGLTVIDISDDTAPFVVAAPGTGMMDGMHALAISGDLAYVLATGGLQVVDISDPYQPTVVRKLEAPSFRGFLPGDIQLRGDRLFVGSSRTVAVFDLAVPDYPVLLRQYTVEGAAVGMAFKEGTLLVAEFNMGVTALPLECSTKVPILLQSFDIEASQGTVRLRWTLAEGSSPSAFRVEARRGNELWMLEASGKSDGSFYAVDRSYRTAQGGEIRYTLLIEGSNGQWAPLAGRTISLRPVVLATTLHGAAPNPFNPTTEIRFDLSRAMSVELKIFDSAGRLVRDLSRGQLAAGPHGVEWDGRDARNRALASGVYFIRMRVEDLVTSERVVLLK